jgi:hypothetical protein
MDHELNFVDLVLTGYFKNKSILGQYYFRQMKLALEKHYSAVEFFDKCSKVCDMLQEDITKQVIERRSMIINALSAAEQGKLEVSLIQGKTKEELLKESINYWQEEYELGYGTDWCGSIVGFHAHLHNLTKGHFRGHLRFDEINQIRSSLIDAFNLYKKDILKETDDQLQEQNSIKPTKADILKERLTEYGFYDLHAISSINKVGKSSLIEKMSKQGLPYSVALLDHVGFIQHFLDYHCESRSNMHKTIATWFTKDKTGRSVKGNLSTLVSSSKEDKKRYTAYKHKETVKIDIDLLKKGVLPS